MQLTATVLSTIALASAAFAQTTGSSSKSTMVHVVQVGQNGLMFTPDQLTAAVGDMVQFQFWPQNHSVVQSSFDSPCMPLGSTMMMSGSMNSMMNSNMMMGFNSGFMPVAADATMHPVFTIQINNTNPIWIHCSQMGHCQSGMVMAINVAKGSNETLAAFKAMAMSSTGTSTSSGSMTTATMMSGNKTMMTGSMTMMMSTATSTMTSMSMNAAAKPVVNSAGLAGLFVAGLGLIL